MHVSTRKNTAYSIWSFIYSRSFSFSSRKNNPEFQKYTAIPEWSDFEIFKHWLESRDYEGKEMVVDGFHFSPETVRFV